MAYTINGLLTLTEFFVVLVFAIEMLCEPTRRAADLVAGGNRTWPLWHEEQVSASAVEKWVVICDCRIRWNGGELKGEQDLFDVQGNHQMRGEGRKAAEEAERSWEKCGRKIPSSLGVGVGVEGRDQ